MGYWVVGEYWLVIQSFNEQTVIINIYTFIFKKLKWIHFNPEVTKYIYFNPEKTISKSKIKTVNLKIMKMQTP